MAAIKVTTPSVPSDVAAMYVTYRLATTDQFQSQQMAYNSGHGAWETNVDTSSGTLNGGYTYKPRQFDPNGDNTVDPSDTLTITGTDR